MTIADQTIRRFSAWAICAILLNPATLLACSVCGGNPESDMVKGAKAGVLVMVVVVYAVMLTMIGIAGCWFVRARRLAAAKSNTPSQDS